MSIQNLKQETLDHITNNGKTWDDVEFVSNGEIEIDKDSFLKKADFDYCAGHGLEYVSLALLIVGKDWWLERHEYDGAEWWEFKSKPARPSKIDNDDCILQDHYDCAHYKE